MNNDAAAIRGVFFSARQYASQRERRATGQAFSTRFRAALHTAFAHVSDGAEFIMTTTV
jgi:hypothetical protein